MNVIPASTLRPLLGALATPVVSNLRVLHPSLLGRPGSNLEVATTWGIQASIDAFVAPRAIRDGDTARVRQAVRRLGWAAAQTGGSLPDLEFVITTTSSDVGRQITIYGAQKQLNRAVVAETVATVNDFSDLLRDDLREGYEGGEFDAPVTWYQVVTATRRSAMRRVVSERNILADDGYWLTFIIENDGADDFLHALCTPDESIITTGTVPVDEIAASMSWIDRTRQLIALGSVDPMPYMNALDYVHLYWTVNPS